MPFVLSAVFSGQDYDLQVVYPLANGTDVLASGSSKRSTADQQWHCTTTFCRHSGSALSVTAAGLPNDPNPQVRS
jgi:hypothetical protein